jgi:anti-anti-sigma factor
MALEVVRLTHSPDVTVLEIRGRVTLGLDTRQLENTVSELEREGVTRLVFDLAGVDYMDSAGLGVLTRCCSAMRNTRGAFHLARPNQKVQQLLRVTRLDEMIHSFSSVAEACEAFREVPR